MRKFGVCLYALALLVVGLVVRIWSLGAESPSFEEISASLAAVAGGGRYLHGPELDLCPPLFYLILHPITWAGGSLGLMRLPSAIAGALAGVLLYLLGRRLFTDRAAAIGAFLLALDPLHVFYSQEVQPAVLFTLVLLPALYYHVRSAETSSFRDWLLYDMFAVMLLYLHPKAAFTVIVFLILHFAVIPLFRNPGEQRRIRLSRRLGMLAFNYAIVVAVALPWLFIMPTKASWQEARPDLLMFTRAFFRYPFFGMVREVALGWFIAVALVLLLLLPPLRHLLRSMTLRLFVLLGVLILVPALPFAYSFFGRVRFSAARDAALITPILMLALGLLIGRCVFTMRAMLLLVLSTVFAFSVSKQALNPQKLDWNKIGTTVEKAAKPGDLLVYWPDMTTRVGEYYFGSKYQIAAASDLLDKWADSPTGQTVFFIVTQNFPSAEPYVYTFPGALRHYATTEMLWQHRLNFVARSTNLNMFNLRLWYDEPQSLNIVDAPTSQTQFIYTPTHEVFRNPKLFHSTQSDMGYEMSGRRIVWTAVPQVSLELPVTLAPGSYVLKLHCSPQFEQPEFGISRERKVTVQLRNGILQRRTTIDGETTIRLPFTTETEMQMLRANIEITPTEMLGHPKRPFGIKIYSISIDEAAEQPSGQAEP